MNDLDDIQQVLSQMRSDTGSYPDRPDFDLTSLPSSSMGRLFGERNLGNRQISAFKPTGEEENLRVRLNILRESEYALAFPFLDKQIIDFGKWGCDFGKRESRELPK